MYFYKIKADDINNIAKFPYSKILQTRWATKDCPGVDSVRAIFEKETKALIREYKATNKRDAILWETLCNGIHAIVLRLREEYPHCFDEIGWYDRNCILESYKLGLLKGMVVEVD